MAVPRCPCGIPVSFPLAAHKREHHRCMYHNCARTHYCPEHVCSICSTAGTGLVQLEEYLKLQCD